MPLSRGDELCPNMMRSRSQSSARPAILELMVVARAKDVDEDQKRDHDDIVVLAGATWADYQRMLELRGEKARPRITYLEGRLQIMKPSRSHESIKSAIGRLVEVYCLHHGIDFQTVGSWTIEDKDAERGAEPDECYIFTHEDRQRPDLAIEVVWTSGSIDKLEVYRKLGVREVWYWRSGRITPYILRSEQFVEAPGSEVLPGIDLVQLASFIDRPTSAGIREYRAALEAGPCE